LEPFEVSWWTPWWTWSARAFEDEAPGALAEPTLFEFEPNDEVALTVPQWTPPAPSGASTFVVVVSGVVSCSAGRWPLLSRSVACQPRRTV
jgi:hypothetical protein